MKTITFIVLALAAVSFSLADNDGRYHPEQYGGRYNSLAQRNSKYGSIYNGNAYQPSYYQALNRELLTPAVSYGDSVEQATAFPTTYRTAFPTAYPTAFPTTVTYRTPVTPAVPTYRPFAYSTPKPFAYSTPKSFAYTTPKPFAASTKSPAAIYQKSVSDSAASIIRQDRTFDENNYHYAYETNNGIAAEESGIVDSSVNGVGGGTRVRGFYEYIGDDGLKYRVDYIADENGFRASGAHLPKAP